MPPENARGKLYAESDTQNAEFQIVLVYFWQKRALVTANHYRSNKISSLLQHDQHVSKQKYSIYLIKELFQILNSAFSMSFFVLLCLLYGFSFELHWCICHKYFVLFTREQEVVSGWQLHAGKSQTFFLHVLERISSQDYELN